MERCICPLLHVRCYSEYCIAKENCIIHFYWVAKGTFLFNFMECLPPPQKNSKYKGIFFKLLRSLKTCSAWGILTGNFAYKGPLRCSREKTRNRFFLSFWYYIDILWLPFWLRTRKGNHNITGSTTQHYTVVGGGVYLCRTAVHPKKERRRKITIEFPPPTRLVPNFKCVTTEVHRVVWG